MTTIREQSSKVKETAAQQLPSDVLEVFDRSIQDLVNEGVSGDAIAVGDELPAFTLDDATGGRVSLDQILETGPAVIVFYRGGWCPYCNLALRTYQTDLLPRLGNFNARLIAISPQSPDESLSTAEKADLDFTVLSDPGARLAYEVGIAFRQPDDVVAAQAALGLHLASVNADGALSLPRPAVLIVDPDRIVRFVDIQPDYTARTEVPDIVAALESLG
ncbi:peroxiredoxin-like family protein [Jongsikchunia kroppenstedtii]|uniref:peroxiredoxin-like family protein n=1 Tax=Jongsikchunia kroppenstedtii TaxID=1121721 RepID=UPI00035E0F62|nr:peroxiredoxin-like family protein [Jongsikchunia kroppenstedtii]